LTAAEEQASTRTTAPVRRSRLVGRRRWFEPPTTRKFEYMIEPPADNLGVISGPLKHE